MICFRGVNRNTPNDLERAFAAAGYRSERAPLSRSGGGSSGFPASCRCELRQLSRFMLTGRHRPLGRLTTSGPVLAGLGLAARASHRFDRVSGLVEVGAHASGDVFVDARGPHLVGVALPRWPVTCVVVAQRGLC